MSPAITTAILFALVITVLISYWQLFALRDIRDELRDLSNKLFPVEPIHPGQVARLYYGQLSTPDESGGE